VSIDYSDYSAVTARYAILQVRSDGFRQQSAKHQRETVAFVIISSCLPLSTSSWLLF